MTAARPGVITDAHPDAVKWDGPTRPYDLVKEFVAALVVVALLTAVLAGVFSSPDDKQVTLAQWANASSTDFIATAATELDGTSGSASYGAPYTHDPGAAQKIGPISPQNWPGVTIPINPADDFVVGPLQGASAGIPDLKAALNAWTSAAPAQQQQWASAYDDALSKAGDGGPAQVAAGDYGPVPVMLTRLLALGRSGGLDGALLSQGHFYQTDYTKPLLFLADGTYLESLTRAQHLGGDQWGMMNETGNYPGQAWLWLYTFWYQVKPFSTSGNADALVWSLMMLLTAVFVFVPFIPGLRSIPKLSQVYRIIWRSYYRDLQLADAAARAKVPS
ncbi:MAG: hypothetical protein QOE76_212 [Frankiales bacterium]|jgi:hypothetical protein|nr:hypothetical protein [Frankiales bacterium]MDX6242489.1 hypothetical protein [Frankiales bacterium]